MKTKIFKIRLSEEFIYDDQKRLDHFLQENNINVLTRRKNSNLENFIKKVLA